MPSLGGARRRRGRRRRSARRTRCSCSWSAPARSTPTSRSTRRTRRRWRRSAGASTACPLAIELAAARVHVDEPGRDRRRARPALRAAHRRAAAARSKRHQTLRATIDWSYDLLDEPQQRLLGRGSPCSPGVAPARRPRRSCAGGPIEGRDVLELADRPGGRSLVVAETRWCRHPLPAVGDDPRVRRGTPRRTRRDRRVARPSRRATTPSTPPLQRRDVGIGADRVGRPHDRRRREHPRRVRPHGRHPRPRPRGQTAGIDQPGPAPDSAMCSPFPSSPVLAVPGVEHHPGYPLVLMAAAFAAEPRGEASLALEYGDAALDAEQALTGRPSVHRRPRRASPRTSQRLVAAVDGRVGRRSRGVSRRRRSSITGVRTRWAVCDSAGAAASALCLRRALRRRGPSSRPKRWPSPARSACRGTPTKPRRARPGAFTPRSRAGPRPARRSRPPRPRLRGLRRTHSDDPRRHDDP